MHASSTLFFVLLALFLSIAFASTEGVSSSNGFIMNSIIASMVVGVSGSLIQRLAPKFVFSLLPYHSVSC